MPFDKSGVAFSYYSCYWLPVRIIRRIVRKLRLYYFYPIFYGSWKKMIKDTDLVIMFDAGIENADDLARYIKRVNSKIKIFFWYWNPINNNKAAFDSKFIDEIWTYSRFDAQNYRLKYNCQFYPQVLTNQLRVGHNNIFTDIVFLGADKGRKQILDELKVCAERQGLKCSFTVIETKSESVEYGTYIDCVKRSRCVVDIVPNQSCGLTLRPLEALFYGKKLITNYQDIVNYDFYNQENIFIIGKDDVTKLAEFVKSPYRIINKKIVDFYSFENWLRRIERNEDVKP